MAGRTRRIARTILVHRHGDRTTIAPLGAAHVAAWRARLPSRAVAAALRERHPLRVDGGGEATDAWLNRTVGGEGAVWGQLTQVGVDQLYALGRDMRCGNGVDDLPLEPSAVSVFSTGRLRTVQSTSSLLNGLLSENVEVVVGASAAAAMVPDDPAKMSSRQLELRDAHFAGDAVRAAEDAMEGVREHLVRAMDESGILAAPAAEASWEGLFEVLHCHAAHGALDVALPSLDADAAAELTALAGQHVTDRWFGLYGSSAEYARLSIGRFVGHLGAVMAPHDRRDTHPSLVCAPRVHRLEGSGPELSVFSAHDSTLTALIQALGITPIGGGSWTDIPPYASCLRIDVDVACEGSEGEEPRVRFRFNGTDVEHCGAERPALSTVLDRFASRAWVGDPLDPAVGAGPEFS